MACCQLIWKRLDPLRSIQMRSIFATVVDEMSGGIEWELGRNGTRTKVEVAGRIIGAGPRSSIRDNLFILP